MRPDRIRLSVLTVVTVFVFPGPTIAQTTNTDSAIAELRQLLADQRATLDRQARIIEEQGRRLTALQERVDARPPVSQQPTGRTAAEPTPDLPAMVVSAGDFPGSIRVPGTESAFKLGGQARLVAVHTLSALGTEDRFITSSIPVGVPRAGDEARTVYSPIASRLNTELRMPSERGPSRLFIETDFAGSGRTSRLRHAFLQTNHFVVGQTWSTFSDPEADTLGIDFEGLNAISRFRQPLFRWTPSGASARYQWAFAVENPAPDLTGAEGLNFTPDFIARLKFQPGVKRGLALYTDHVQASLLVRQLRGQVPGQAGDALATGGIGGNISGVLVPRWDADDRIKFAVNVGSGIGRYIADLSSLRGQDAVYDPVQGSLRALSVSSGYFGYEHAWSRVFTTAVTYGAVNVSNLDIQLEDAFHRTQRTSINLMCNPVLRDGGDPGRQNQESRPYEPVPCAHHVPAPGFRTTDRSEPRNTVGSPRRTRPGKSRPRSLLVMIRQDSYPSSGDGRHCQRGTSFASRYAMNTVRLHSAVHQGVVALLLAAVTACSGKPEAAPPPATAAATPAAADAAIPQTVSPYDALPENVQLLIDKPFTGDFDAMVARRAIRVAVTFSRTHYFIDKGQERGLTYEALKLFENDLNADLKTGNLKVHVVIVPMTRNQLYPALATGKVDMVAAMVTVRPELETRVAFSVPTRTNVNEVVVTGPGAPPIATVDDLAGQAVFVRKGSIYQESLVRLNEQLKARGKPPVVIDEAPDVLEDDDVLEMVNAGLVPITVVDDYLAEFWSKVFSGITVHSDIALRSGGSLAVAFRKENPKLREVVDSWIRKHPKGDAFRNTIERRYLDSVKYAKNAAADAERQKLQAVVELFKKYGAQYDLDYLLMAAQGYQESTLDQDVKSPVGAIGVMQVMPPTGKELNVGDITKVDANIHAGVKYMRFMMDQYFKDEPMDPLNKGLMTFAAYNAGPGRLRQLRRETEKRGLDPNVWFGNVERVASERIGRETVTYVSNIYKYYIAYRLLSDQRDRREAAKADVAKRK